jgi:L-seryl-tRNA(Ser) seleniumtransferase
MLDEILSNTRRELQSSSAEISRADLTASIAQELATRLRTVLNPSLRRVINCSGVVLHTNLGRAPLPAEAFEHLREVSVGYSNLEFDLEGGERGKRDKHIEKTLQHLLGCEAAIVVNNNAAAVLLVLNALGEGGEVVASRGEQVEIGGSFRIPEIMIKSGAVLREVGTTNRTRIKDYEKAINDRTRLLLRVHPSNFRMVGFTERPSLVDFVELGRRRNIPTFEDLGSGCMIKIADEPVVMESIRAGVDIVCFSGDKMLGGPQAGVIAGKKLYLERIRQNPLFRALRVDKLTISILSHVLRIYLKGSLDEIPVVRMLTTNEAELRTRAETFAKRIGSNATIMKLESVVGGGSAPETVLPSWGVALSVRGLSEGELEARLRESDPPVIVRIEEGQVILDFRTIFASDEEPLITQIQRITSVLPA